MPIRKLHWIDGKLNLFGYDHFFSKVLSKVKLPSNILSGIGRIAKEFDIIHVSENYHFFSFQGAFWSKVRHKKFVFSAGENIPYYPKNVITWQVKKFVNKVAVGITTTTPLGKRALICEGVDPNKIEVIPNALDFTYFNPGPKDSSKLNLPEELQETFNILFVGKLTEQKGIYYLLKAFEELKHKIKNIRLILVGPNYLPQNYYKSYIECNDLIYPIRYIPNTKIQYAYNLCDIFILPSITMPNNKEQFGMVVLEAMACGKPTIVTDVGGLPYIVKAGKTSIVIPERSCEAIIKAVIKLYNDEKLRESLGRYSYYYVRKNFSKEVIGHRLYVFYKKIMSNNSR